MESTDRLSQRLDLEFHDADLLDEALSHRSSGARHYERLEFLGDSLLNFVIAAELYERHEDADEGALSRLRASLVCEDTLASIARQIELGDYLKLGGGELKSGGFDRDSILADAVESLIGATLCDAGFERARRLVLELFGERLDTLPPAANLKDPKTRLQELLQGRGLARPIYEVVDTEGKAHALRFTVRCQVPEPTLEITATASSRRKAEQAAAEAMLQRATPLLS